MDCLQDLMQDFCHYLVYHPYYSAGAIFTLLGCLLRFYCRVTLGVCNSNQDMTNKTVLITGATAGIGKATAMEMARRNARVLLACRNAKKAKEVAEEIKLTTGNQNVFVKTLDLTSFASVRACAKSVLDTEENLHVLINNAGIAGPRKRILTADGCEVTMQSNHFGHFLLTLLLLDLVKRSSPSRIINVSSAANYYHKFDVEDLNNRKEIFSLFVYANTKLANVLFTVELADRLKGSGVTVNSLHPGGVISNFLDPVDTILGTVTKFFIYIFGKTSEEGAQTTIQLAVDPNLEKTTGKYFSDCKIAPLVKAAHDKRLTKRLFEISERIVGESFCKN